MKENNNTVSFCTVTPVYAGQEYLIELVNRLKKLRDKWENSDAPLKLIESIFVDDGSVDGSAGVLESLREQHPWIRVVTLSRNFGQHAATNAGVCHSSADWVVTLDEDLQHDPDLIETLLVSQVENNADVIYAQSKTDIHGGGWRDKSSKLVKRILARLTSTPQIILFNSFRLIRGDVARAAASSSSRNTYFDIALSWFTKSAFSVKVDMHDDRFVTEKQSGYGFIKLINHARRLIVSSDLDVASFGMLIGFGSIGLAGILAIVLVFLKVFMPGAIGLEGWTSLIVIVTFFSGILIALLCLVLEYLSVIVLNSLGKPVFFSIDRSGDKILKDWFG